ncbi:type I secretion system permease/ATPase [Tistrella bauzanensis]|uniref:type I secretion system permease/ATPase n=1 Tax=Tistrella TaxID=171436 RepID=UPI0031F5F0C8
MTVSPPDIPAMARPSAIRPVAPVPGDDVDGARLIARARAAIRRHLGATAVFSAGVNLLYLTPSLYMLQVYDRVLSSGSGETLMFVTVIALVALLTMASLDRVRGILMSRAGLRVDRVLAGPLLARLIRQSALPGQPPAAQPLRDLETLRMFLSGPAPGAMFDLPWMPVYVAIMWIIHPWLGMLALGGSVLLLTLAIAGEYSMRKAAAAAGQAQLRAHAAGDALIREAEPIEAMGLAPALIGRWHDARMEGLAGHARSAERGAFWSAATKGVRLSLQILVLAIGAWLAIEREVTPGAMFAGSILIGRALAPIEQIVGMWRQMTSAREAYGRVKTALAATPPPRPGQTELPRPKGAITLDRVVFRMAGAERPAIGGVDLDVRAGETIGILGPSAAGKSTLLRLMIGLWVPLSGSVRLDGADAARWPRERLGPAIGYLPQDVVLLAGSVRDNIARFGDADDALVIQAAERAGAHDMILALPQGYDTRVGDGGIGLSGGQRQRIGFARALYGDPAIIALDEPNSSLDNDGEQALVIALKHLRTEGRTVLIVAHRTGILGLSDRLLVLREGRVHMYGPTAEVVKALSTPRAEGGRPPAPTHPNAPHPNAPQPQGRPTPRGNGGTDNNRRDGGHDPGDRRGGDA